jgi:hypothetical protein
MVREYGHLGDTGDDSGGCGGGGWSQNISEASAVVERADKAGNIEALAARHQ